MNPQVNQLRAWMTEEEIDAFLITDPRNRTYLSGFTGSSGALLVTGDAQYLITDFRYVEQAGQQAPQWSLWKQTGSLQVAINELLAALQPATVAFEADALTVAEWQALEGEEESEWVATESLVRELRAIKRPDEIEAIRHAQRITDEAATHLPRLIQPGQTERAVAWELEKLLRELGADGAAFDIIVASGPNSALPHYRPAERVIQPDEIVLVDFGARRAGYHSDMTRTYFTGEPTPLFRERFALVLEALTRAEQAMRAGQRARAMDGVARGFLTEQGYGEAFGHGLGHGVGLDIHELPTLSYRADEEDELAAGQLVTVEPGVYLPEWGGIRIEDLVLVTEKGIEILTTTPKEVDAWRQAQ